MSVEVVRVPALSDNYGWLVREPVTGAVASIDTPEVEPLEAALASRGWRLTHILNTHHHGDHVGGNAELKRRWGCVVVGPRDEADAIPGLDLAVGDGDVYRFGAAEARIIGVPGHTRGHIAWWFPKSGVAFVGDTVFSLGCGRLFEGTAVQMWSSLAKLRALPDETILHCAHEYTESNARFAMTIEPGNPALVARVAEVQALRARGEPTVPMTLGLERATNPFLRPDSAEIQATVGMIGGEPAAVFGEVRRRKDVF